MTNAPSDLLGLRATLEQLTGLPAVDVGIVGDAAHARSGGYHIGRSGLQAAGVWSTDYSVRLQRDRNGATESASAMDVGAGWRQGRATWLRWNQLLANALRSNDPALAAVRAINYSPDGSTKWRLDREAGWRTASTSDTVDIHTHIEWYRDTEGRRQQSLDRIAALARQAITGQLAPGGDDMLTQQEHDEIIGGALSPDNVLHYRLRGLLDGDDPDLQAYYDKGWAKPVGIKQLAAKLDALAAAVATPAKVDVQALAAAIVAALPPAATVDVQALAGPLADALAQHLPSHITLTGTVTP